MRPISTTYQTILNSLASDRRVSLRVEVDRSGVGGWIDLTSYLGRDWVRRVQYGASLGDSVANATVELWRGDLLSLSPWMTASQANVGGTLIYPYRKIRISAATTPSSTPPESSDYVIVFAGRIADVRFTRDGIVLRCRDDGGDLQDAFITETRFYGDDGGSVSMESVIQTILTEWGGSVTLYSPNSTGSPAYDPSDATGWAIKRYEQQRMPVLNAIKILADQIGYDLRYRYQNNIQEIALVLSQPDRALATPDATFTASGYIIDNASIDITRIRNRIRGIYTDKAGTRQTREVSDAPSIASFGNLFMEISEERTSQIDTSTEMDSMLNGILDDLKDPTIILDVRIPYFYVAELGDLYRFEADGVYSDVDRDVAVQSIQHTIEAGAGWTTLNVQGKPASKTSDEWAEIHTQHAQSQVSGRNINVVGNRRVNLLGNGLFSQWSRG